VRLIFIGKCSSLGDRLKNDNVNIDGTSTEICSGWTSALGIKHKAVETLLNYKLNGLFRKAVNGW